MGEGFQRAADSSDSQPAAELRYHERPTKAPTAAQGSPGCPVEQKYCCWTSVGGAGGQQTGHQVVM